MGKHKSNRRHTNGLVALELTPRTMLCLLEHGFKPKDNESFINALFEQREKMTDREFERFKKYIGASGTDEEKKRLAKLDTHRTGSIEGPKGSLS